MREFAEQEIRIPTGEYEGLRFNCDRQPFTRLWLDAVDSGRWRRFFSLGPTQSGKTLLCFVIPALYYLFEMGESIICGVPSLDMVGDKWEDDLLPAIQASRYRELLPRRGPGSRGGGSPIRITFRNGAQLRFMTGGGGDKARAAKTARIVIVTETDAFADAGGTSDETSKLKQLEARTLHYKGRARFFAECTVTIETAPTWSEYLRGTESRIAMPCLYCDTFVTPDRDDLVGWRDASSVVEAAKQSAWACPDCSYRWKDEDRENAVRESVLVHGTQHVDGLGNVMGEPKPTETLGFRWSAADNLFTEASYVGAQEWRTANADDEDLAERETLQFWWALPHRPPKNDLSMITVETVQERTTQRVRGTIPPETTTVTVGVDVGKYWLYWGAIAFRGYATGAIIDYGRRAVASGEIGEERAIMHALRELRDELAVGWPDDDGVQFPIAQALVDSGWQKDVVYSFCQESGAPWIPSKGYGATQRRGGLYAAPSAVSRRIARIGEEYHVSRQPASADRRTIKLCEANADHWKSWLHSRFLTPAGQPGSISLFRDSARHRTLGKHLSAERQVEEYSQAKRAMVMRWEQIRSANHLLDALYLACVAGHLAGVRLDGEVRSKRRTVSLDSMNRRARRR